VLKCGGGSVYLELRKREMRGSVYKEEEKRFRLLKRRRREGKLHC